MKTLKNYFFTIGYQIFSIILPLITMPYVSRILGPTGLGKFNASFSLSQLFVIFSMLGIQKYGSLIISRDRDDSNKNRKDFYELYTTQFFFSVISYLFYIGVIYLITNGQDKVLYLVQGFYIFAAALDTSWYYQGKEMFGTIVKRSVFSKVLGVLLIFVFVKKAEDYIIYAAILCSSIFLSNLIMTFYLFKTEFKSFRLKFIWMRKRFYESFMFFIPSAINQISIQIIPILIGIYLSQADVSFYSNGLKIILIPMYIITSLITVLYPRVVFEGKKPNSNVSNTLSYSISFILLLIFPLTVGLISLAPNLVPWFFGNDFLKVTSVIIILSLRILPSALIEFFGNLVLIPKGLTKEFTFLISFESIFSILGGGLLSVFWGVKGFCWGIVIGDFLCLFFVIIYVQRFKLKLLRKEYIHFILYSTIMYGAIQLVTSLTYFKGFILSTFQIVIGLVVYLTLILLFSRNELKRIIKLFK